MNNTSETSKDENRAKALAYEIAQAFGDMCQLELYQRICLAHERRIVYRAFREAVEIPLSKVKKTRRALFIFLIRKYEKQ